MSSVFKVLIIGSGQLGSRHLQGALKSHNKLSIVIVDPSLNALKLSKIRANEIELGHQDSSTKYTQRLPKNQYFNICIISTNANIRAEVTKDFLENCKTDHIIFEKVLFQKDEDFEFISKLIKEKNISSWVNCPRRTYSHYQEIKKILDIKKTVEMSVTGSSWGMACNTIHFIDLFSYLVNSSNLKIVKTKFSKHILNSKRGNNFYEINGLMELQIDTHTLKIYCKNGEKVSLNLKIKNNNNEFSFDELNGILQSNIGGTIKIRKQKTSYQSSETTKIINNLIDKNQCDLTSYQESYKHHLPLLTVIKKHLSLILKKEFTGCPIT